MELPQIDNINIFLVLGIIAIAVISVIVISKCFNSRKKTNAKNMVQKSIDELRK